jgi:hypothetical protein
MSSSNMVRSFQASVSAALSPAASDEIAKYRLELNNLLWDFEDYMEPDGYEKGPYTDLQALCKNAGLGIGEVLKRMKIDPLAAAPQTGDDSSRRASAATATTPSMFLRLKSCEPPTLDGVRLVVRRRNTLLTPPQYFQCPPRPRSWTKPG